MLLRKNEELQCVMIVILIFFFRVWFAIVGLLSAICVGYRILMFCCPSAQRIRLQIVLPSGNFLQPILDTGTAGQIFVIQQLQKNIDYGTFSSIIRSMAYNIWLKPVNL